MTCRTLGPKRPPDEPRATRKPRLATGRQEGRLNRNVTSPSMRRNLAPLATKAAELQHEAAYCDVLSRMLTLLLTEFAAARSSLPSPFQSPVVTERGFRPTE